MLDKNQLDKQLKKLKLSDQNIKHLICNAGQSSYPQNEFSCYANIERAIQENVIVASNSIYYTLKHHKNTLKTVTIIGSICGEEYISGAPLEYDSKILATRIGKLTAYNLSKIGVVILLRQEI